MFRCVERYSADCKLLLHPSLPHSLTHHPPTHPLPPLQNPDSSDFKLLLRKLKQQQATAGKKEASLYRWGGCGRVGWGGERQALHYAHKFLTRGYGYTGFKSPAHKHPTPLRNITAVV